MTSDRFGSLTDILSNRPTQKPATVHAISSGVERGSDSTEGSTKRTGGHRKSLESRGGTRRVAFRLDPVLHARLVAHAKEAGISQGNTVLDAIEAAHSQGRLEQMVADARDSAGPTDSGGLFTRTVARGTALPSVPVEIQIRVQALEELDRLVISTEADNRTQLMVAALRAYLA